MWCHGSSHIDRRCHFRNVCYNPKADAFVFFRHLNSVLSGVPKDRFSPTLLEWSSVADHNRLFFNYVDVPASEARRVLHEHVYVTDTVFTFKRVLADDLMHIIHDDLLPAFVTLRHIRKQTSGPFPVQLLFMDTYARGPYWSLYASLTDAPPMIKSDLHSKSLTCFHDLHVGISKETLWYDHGFKEPQTPLVNSSVDAFIISQFTNYMRASLNVNSASRVTPHKKSAVLLVRRQNRVILNEAAVVSELTSLQFDVSVVAAESAVLREAIERISGASLIVALHDPLLILAMFAPAHTLLLECFPYALKPDNYVMYKTLAQLPGVNLTYATWRNMHEERSLTHPTRDWRHGGIEHLSPAVQLRVRTSPEVPRHKCCYEPQYMYRLYQDTAIDVSDIRHIITSHFNDTPATSRSSDVLQDLLHSQMPPGPVLTPVCRPMLGETHPLLRINWEHPLNWRLVPHDYMLYEVVLQEAGSQEVLKWSVRRNHLQVMSSIQPKKRYFVWVRALFNDALAGPFNTDELLCVT